MSLGSVLSAVWWLFVLFLFFFKKCLHVETSLWNRIDGWTFERIIDIINWTHFELTRKFQRKLSKLFVWRLVRLVAHIWKCTLSMCFLCVCVVALRFLFDLESTLDGQTQAENLQQILEKQKLTHWMCWHSFSPLVRQLWEWAIQWAQ